MSVNVSVYISSYNQKQYLKDAIESVLGQTLRPFEVLIVDDCSTDGSQDLIRAYANSNSIIRYLFNEVNEGIARVRQSAIDNSRGDYLTYVDGDDLYLPHKLETEVRLMKSGDYDVAFSNNLYVNPDDPNDVKWIWAYNKGELPLPGNMYLDTLTRKFPRGSLFRMEMVNANLIQSTGAYDNNLKIYEDYDFRIRLSLRAKINYTLEPTTKIRISKAGLSKSAPESHHENLLYIFRKYDKEIELLSEPTRSLVRKRIGELLARDKGERLPPYNILKNLKTRLINLILRS